MGMKTVPFEAKTAKTTDPVEVVRAGSSSIPIYPLQT